MTMENLACWWKYPDDILLSVFMNWLDLDCFMTLDKSFFSENNKKQFEAILRSKYFVLDSLVILRPRSWAYLAKRRINCSKFMLDNGFSVTCTFLKTSHTFIDVKMITSFELRTDNLRDLDIWSN